MGTYFSFPDLLIWLPLLAGALCFVPSVNKQSKNLSLLFSLIILGVSLASLFFTNDGKYLAYNHVSYMWLKYLGANYYIGLDGAGRSLTLLTAIVFPLIIISSFKKEIPKTNSFYGLLMLSQAGLMGVFMAMDALSFYFFWELALVPVYFLASKWGGEKAIASTFKFFVYTFAGSLLMLVGIIYVYLHTGGRTFEDGTISSHSFALTAFYQATLSTVEQTWLFVLFFVAFAIKMPIFPFHTWQPEAYNQSPTPVTMVMSAVMVKMGLLGVFRWLIPMFGKADPHVYQWAVILSVIGIVYASCLALVQDNLKKLVAYSSIAHIGLMSAGLFTMKKLGVQGAFLQMFNHGINIIGMWVVVEIIERKTGNVRISELGGLAKKAPALTIFLVIIAFANIALPLTNAFPGEFLMFTGLYQYQPWLAVAAGLGIILSALYTLNMIQKVFFGSTNGTTEMVNDIALHESIVLIIIVLIIFAAGIYPQPLIELTKSSADQLFTIIK